MNIVGLDLSLTATGIADHGDPHVLRSGKLRGVQRVHWISCQVDTICTRPRADVVVIEDYAYGATHQGPQLGELGGVVKVVLFQRGIPFVVVPSARMKKFATGKGNASKDEVLAAAVRAGAPVDDNNAADAYWLRCMGLAHYEQRDAVLPEYRQAVLQSIQWPSIEREETAA